MKYLIIILLLTGCAIIRPQYRISGDISRSEVARYRAEAERLLGMSWRGNRVRVTVREGTHPATGRPGWMGSEPILYDGRMMSVLGHWNPQRGITLYTTNGKVRRETAVHEWGHEILWSNGVHYDQHHRIMRESGVP